MQVVKNNKRLFVGWKYDNPVLQGILSDLGITYDNFKKMNKGELAKQLGLPHLPQPETTWCVIRDEEGNTVAEASVRKHVNDLFDKDQARRFSLEKVLNRTYPGAENKQTRRDFWKAYLDRKTVKNAEVFKETIQEGEKESAVPAGA